jgi:hypothetical protein
MLAHFAEQNANLLKDKDALKLDKDMLVRQLEVKDQQLATKDSQIDRFFTSERDTKTLLGSLQSLVNAIWPKAAKEVGERYVPMRDALDSGLAPEQKGEGER